MRNLVLVFGALFFASLFSCVSENGQDEKDDQQKDDQEGDEGEENPEDQEIEAVLKKAQERSDEHEAEKKARMRGARLPPNERDW